MDSSEALVAATGEEAVERGVQICSFGGRRWQRRNKTRHGCHGGGAGGDRGGGGRWGGGGGGGPRSMNLDMHQRQATTNMHGWGTLDRNMMSDGNAQTWRQRHTSALN